MEILDQADSSNQAVFPTPLGVTRPIPNDYDATFSDAGPTFVGPFNDELGEPLTEHLNESLDMTTYGQNALEVDPYHSWIDTDFTAPSFMNADPSGWSIPNPTAPIVTQDLAQSWEPLPRMPTMVGNANSAKWPLVDPSIWIPDQPSLDPHHFNPGSIGPEHRLADLANSHREDLFDQHMIAHQPQPDFQDLFGISETNTSTLLKATAPLANSLTTTVPLPMGSQPFTSSAESFELIAGSPGQKRAKRIRRSSPEIIIEDGRGSSATRHGGNRPKKGRSGPLANTRRSQAAKIRNEKSICMVCRMRRVTVSFGHLSILLMPSSPMIVRWYNALL